MDGSDDTVGTGDTDGSDDTDGARSSGGPLLPRAWVDRHPVAAALEAMTPGLGLVGVLEELEAADLDGAALVEAVAGWERVAGWVVARQGRLIAEMARRARGVEIDQVPDEVAARLATTRRAAERACDLALALDQAPEVSAALESGLIDARKARVIVEGAERLPAHLAEAVRAEALNRAPGLTAPQLTATLRGLEIAADAQAAEARHVQARAERCVRMSPAPDAMAWIHALLPAPDALTVLTAVDALAAACAPEDARGIDERRADALVDVLREVLDTGIGPTGPLPTTQRRRPHLSIVVNPAALQGHPDAVLQGHPDTVLRGQPDTVLQGHPDTVLQRHPDTVLQGDPATAAHSLRGEPVAAQPAVDRSAAHAYLAGYGPVPAAVIHEVARQASWRAVGADPRTGELAARSSRSYRPSAAIVGMVIDRDVTCTFPGCRVPSPRSDIDHIEPFDPDEPPERQTTLENLHALCRHHHRLKTQGHWTPVRDAATGVTTWTSSTGHVYTRDPIPIDPTQHNHPRRRPRPTIDADDPSALAEPRADEEEHPGANEARLNDEKTPTASHDETRDERNRGAREGSTSLETSLERYLERYLEMYLEMYLGSGVEDPAGVGAVGSRRVSVEPEGPPIGTLVEHPAGAGDDGSVQGDRPDASEAALDVPVDYDLALPPF